MILQELQALKKKAEETQTQDQWNLCIKFLKENPLHPYWTTLDGVQMLARREGLAVEEKGSPSHREWKITIP